MKAGTTATRAVLPGMVSRRYGRIVQMSSVTGPVVGIAGSSVYAAAKAGMLGMTRALAIEVGPFGVTVNCVGPGWIKTGSSSDAEIVAGRHTPVGRPGTPDEVGHVAVFLASEDALLLLTDVDGVYRDFGTEHAARIAELTVVEARAFDAPAGTMGPKLGAGSDFATLGRFTGIGRLEDAIAILDGRTGTRIVTLDEDREGTGGPRV